MLVLGVLYLIFLINQIDYYFHHNIFFLSLALSNHQGKGYEGVICQTF